MLKEGGGKEESSLIRELRQKLHQIKVPIEKAKAAEKVGQIEQAIDAWRQVLDVIPAHKTALAERGKLEGLLTDFRSRQAKATTLMDGGSFSEADKLLQKCLELNPTCEETNDLLKSCRKRVRQYTEAFNKAEKSTADRVLIDAWAQVTAALSVAPASKEALALQAQLAHVKKEAGELLPLAEKQLAAATFKEANETLFRIKELQADLEGTNRLFKQLQSVKGPYKKAMSEAASRLKARDLSGVEEQVVIALGICTASTEAKNLLEKIRADQEQARTLVSQALAALPGAGFDDASSLLHQAVELWPGCDGLAQAKAKLGKVQKCYVGCLTEARHAFKKKDLDQAVAAAERALKVCPNAQEVRDLIKAADEGRSAALKHLANAKPFIQAAEFSRATEELEAAKSLWALFPDHETFEADMESARRDYLEAIEASRNALRASDYSGALHLCNRALEICPESKDAKNLKEEIEQFIELERIQFLRKQERHYNAIRWSLLAALSILGLVLLLSFNLIFGAAAVGLAVFTAALNTYLNTKLFSRLLKLDFIDSRLQTVLFLLGLLLFVSGILGPVLQSVFGSEGTLALSICVAGYFLAPGAMFVYGLCHLQLFRGIFACLAVLANWAVIFILIWYGVPWLWGLFIEAVWPW